MPNSQKKDIAILIGKQALGAILILPTAGFSFAMNILSMNDYLAKYLTEY